MTDTPSHLNHCSELNNVDNEAATGSPEPVSPSTLEHEPKEQSAHCSLTFTEFQLDAGRCTGHFTYIIYKPPSDCKSFYPHFTDEKLRLRKVEYEYAPNCANVNRSAGLQNFAFVDLVTSRHSLLMKNFQKEIDTLLTKVIKVKYPTHSSSPNYIQTPLVTTLPSITLL